MELNGITVAFLGDSITEGHGTSGEDKRFSALLWKSADLGVALNYGIGATRFSRQVAPEADVAERLPFVDRVETMDNEADLIFVFGGVNDYLHGNAPLGVFTDATPYTFYGACHTLMRSLIEKYPDKPIVFATPLHCIQEYEPRPADKAPLSAYVAAIKETAAYYALPVLDLNAMSGLQPALPVMREMYVPDGLHPNDAGHERLAERIEAYLRAL